MENNNEIIENSEEVMETATEEIVKAASSNSSFSTATKFGLAMIAGGLICKFVVEPGVAKLKRKAEERAAKKVHLILITLLTRIMKKFQMTMLQKNKHRNEF